MSDYRKFRYDGPPALIIEAGVTVDCGDELWGPPSLRHNAGFTDITDEDKGSDDGDSHSATEDTDDSHSDDSDSDEDVSDGSSEPTDDDATHSHPEG